jgi:serine protease Do
LSRRSFHFLGYGLAGVLGLAFGWQARPSVPALAVSAVTPDFTEVASRSTPAVVNISALQVFRTERRSPFFSDPFFREFFGRDLPFRIPQEERKTSLGSGVMVSPDGIIVTNNHVIDQAREIAITTPDRKRHRGELLGTDPATDIAVIRIDGKGLPSLPWGNSSQARVGEYVLAVGNPFRLNQTVTMGIISAVGRSNVGIVDYEDFIQTDAAINPGNSGGALVNTRGELIGINTAIYSETGGYQGIGFAVPSNLVRQVVDDILEHGHVRRGFVGITRVRTVDGQGVLVLELLRGSPADRAGLVPGDLVVAVDGQEVTDAAHLRNDLAAARVGAELRLRVLREGSTIEIRIRVEEAPAHA